MKRQHINGARFTGIRYKYTDVLERSLGMKRLIWCDCNHENKSQRREEALKQLSAMFTV